MHHQIDAAGNHEHYIPHPGTKDPPKYLKGSTLFQQKLTGIYVHGPAINHHSEVDKKDTPASPSAHREVSFIFLDNGRKPLVLIFFVVMRILRSISSANPTAYCFQDPLETAQPNLEGRGRGHRE